MNTSSFNFGKVAVLMGGWSSERAISLMSGQGVLQALRSQGVDAHAFDPAETPLEELKTRGFERCFMTLHGPWGEDGCIQGALELLRIPYTGSGVMASSLAMNKIMTKRIWGLHQLPTPAYVCLQAAQVQTQQLDQVLHTLGLPLIVKPPHEGSSLGVSKVTNASELPAAIELAARYEPDVLCEEFIEGEEFTCAVIGQGNSARTLPLVRICPPSAGYDYQNKYFTDDVKYQCPSGLPAHEEHAIEQMVLTAYRALGCRGWARADLMVRARDHQPFLLEMNTSPGMTNHSLVPKAAWASGLSYEALCLELLQSATLDYSHKNSE